MTNIPFSISPDYWPGFSVTHSDIEYIHNYLFETETPLTLKDLALVVVEARIKSERESALKSQQAIGAVYLPKEKYKAGAALVFPGLDWQKGKVTTVRTGVNPDIENFEVIEVLLEDGSTRLYAAGLEDHLLNVPQEEKPNEDLDPSAVIAQYGQSLVKKLATALDADDDLVSIAGHWFPRALLVDVNVGHLNLAEAFLEMAGGEPMSTAQLMEQIDFSVGESPKLIEFSLDYALQNDKRFDEVGPAGQVLWCLERLEPEEVRNIPVNLQSNISDYDDSVLTKQMFALDKELDDELSDAEHSTLATDSITICLIYPHWRAGTLPLSKRLSALFPTAYETSRVRFSLVDGKTGEEIPAWVVLKHGYVFGLGEWFKKNKLFPGALIDIRRGARPGEVIIEAKTHKPVREWVRTVIAGSDGGLVFAVLKQDVGCEYNERMISVITDPQAVDEAWVQASRSRQPLESMIVNVVHELSKLTPQGHVHAQELYSAINIIRRIPPLPLMSLLATSRRFVHVGDLYFRLRENDNEEDE